MLKEVFLIKDYIINEIAELAGVTTRTLRYYDEINLLKPKRINSSGYRIYGQEEMDLLYQILLYRNMDMALENIKKIISNPNFNELEALFEHKKKLLQKQNEINNLINNVENAIKMKEGKIKMNNNEKFKVFKENLVKENTEKYGEEIEKKYGKEIVEKSNKQMLNLSKKDFDTMNKLNGEIFEVLKEAIKTNNPAGELGQKAAKLHKDWLMFSWGEKNYSKEAHAGVGEMYVADERFKKYYEKSEGMTEFLRDAIIIFTK